jgi:quercetin dioxygenase-like cupin family protein
MEDTSHDYDRHDHVARVGWGGGRQIVGTPFRELVATNATDGHLVVLAVEMPPGLHVDEHTHETEDQILVVLRGEVGVAVAGEVTILTEGAVHLMPRSKRHSLWNPGTESARVLDLYTPGGFEQVFAQSGQQAIGDHEPASSRPARSPSHPGPPRARP